MSGLYPDLSHLQGEERAEYLREHYHHPKHCPHRRCTSGSESDEDIHGPFPRSRNVHCSGCLSREFLLAERNHHGPSAPDEEEIFGWRAHKDRKRVCDKEGCGGPFSSQYCGRCRTDLEEIHGPRPRRGSGCENEDCRGPFSPQYCGHCRPDIDRIYGPRPHQKGSLCEDEECRGPFSLKYCGHCRPDIDEIHGRKPHRRGSGCEDDECGGPFSSKYCGRCRPDLDEIHGHRTHRRGSGCEDDECGGAYSSNYCGHCRPDIVEVHGRRPHRRRSSCMDEECGGPFSSHYCGRCQRPKNETCYHEEAGCHGDGYDAGRHRHEGGGGPPEEAESWVYTQEFGSDGTRITTVTRGRNYVMERERVEEALQHHEEQGPHWWSHHDHHVTPTHHVGLYSWVPCQMGDVPPNAVKVGRDEDGGRTYVGRAWHEGDLLPAKIAPSHGGAFVPYGGLEHSKFDYEVLVSESHRVAWQESSKGNVPPHALVVGHTKHGEALYVGRVLHHGIMTPGKVQHSHGALYIAWSGREIYYDEYEVLVVVDG